MRNRCGVAVGVGIARLKSKARGGVVGVGRQVTSTLAERTVVNVLYGANIVPDAEVSSGIAKSGGACSCVLGVADLGRPVGAETSAGSVILSVVNAEALS